MTDHSHKPEEQYALIERVSPGPYLELFARRRPLSDSDWSVWQPDRRERTSSCPATRCRRIPSGPRRLTNLPSLRVPSPPPSSRAVRPSQPRRRQLIERRRKDPLELAAERLPDAAWLRRRPQHRALAPGADLARLLGTGLLATGVVAWVRISAAKRRNLWSAA